MDILKGHLVLGVETGTSTDARWLFNVESVNGVESIPPASDALKRVKRTGPTEYQREQTEKLMGMKPEEYADYRKEWERTKNARVIGGLTVLRTGDFLEAFEDKNYTDSVWSGVLSLVRVEVSPYEYATDNSELNVDTIYWNDMFVHELPALLYPNFGKAQN